MRTLIHNQFDMHMAHELLTTYTTNRFFTPFQTYHALIIVLFFLLCSFFKFHRFIIFNYYEFLIIGYL